MQTGREGGGKERGSGEREKKRETGRELGGVVKRK
jgi:hypothetical protein